MLRQICCLILLVGLAQGQDWGQLEIYRKANQPLLSERTVAGRVVLYGNSITESWPKFHPEFFDGKPYIPRGISGQTTPQMLVRFRQDVLELGPEVVVILAGTNDIAGNTGPMTLDEIAGNIISMAELAQANGITVVISSVLPAWQYSWKPELTPAGDIMELNGMLKAYCRKAGHHYLDYHGKMKDKRDGLKDAYTYDGVHPNLAGYEVMESRLEKALRKVLK